MCKQIRYSGCLQQWKAFWECKRQLHCVNSRCITMQIFTFSYKQEAKVTFALPGWLVCAVVILFHAVNSRCVEERGCPYLVHLSPPLQNACCECLFSWRPMPHATVPPQCKYGFAWLVLEIASELNSRGIQDRLKC
jgi:hypothetical protein